VASTGGCWIPKKGSSVTFSEGPYQERTDTVVDQQVVAVPAAPVAERVVVADVAPAAVSQVRTAYTARYAPDSVITGIVGLVLLVMGLIAITRNGFDGPMSDPHKEVLGFTHTTTLGLIECAIGLFLLISAAARSRAGEMFFGVVLGIAGFVGAVQTSSFEKNLALESSLAWLAVVAGAVVVLAALLMPRFAKQSSVVEQF